MSLEKSSEEGGGSSDTSYTTTTTSILSSTYQSVVSTAQTAYDQITKSSDDDQTPSDSSKVEGNLEEHQPNLSKPSDHSKSKLTLEDEPSPKETNSLFRFVPHQSAAHGSDSTNISPDHSARLALASPTNCKNNPNRSQSTIDLYGPNSVSPSSHSKTFNEKYSSISYKDHHLDDQTSSIKGNSTDNQLKNNLEFEAEKNCLNDDEDESKRVKSSAIGFKGPQEELKDDEGMLRDVKEKKDLQDLTLNSDDEESRRAIKQADNIKGEGVGGILEGQPELRAVEAKKQPAEESLKSVKVEEEEKLEEKNSNNDDEQIFEDEMRGSKRLNMNKNQLKLQEERNKCQDETTDEQKVENPRMKTEPVCMKSPMSDCQSPKTKEKLKSKIVELKEKVKVCSS
ncbi:hypothetical protein BY996DRAFT_6410007 [Phakopsora pachyrhizi]|nr:hypothetical protein BY996DRAFT_6410007 [Phakopsora pachyrhizi]